MSYLSRLIRFNQSFVGYSNAYNLKSFTQFLQFIKGNQICKWSSITSPLYLKTHQRNYSLKLYSQNTGDEFLWSTSVAKFIKSKNNMLDEDNFDSQMTNVVDNESAIKQLHSIILHSLEIHTEDVIKLFSLYRSYSRLKLNQTYGLKESRKLLQYKVQTNILSMPFDQLNQFSIALKNILSFKIEFFSQLAVFIFEECYARAENCQSLSEMIQYFMIGMHLFGNGVSYQHEFSNFITLFHKHINEASPSQLCDILHFCGLARKNSLSEISNIAASSLFSKLDEISFPEFGIAANALFRLQLKLDHDTGSLIKKKLLQNINLQDNSLVLDNMSSFAFVSLIKYLRMIKYVDDELMGSIKLFLECVDENVCNPQFISHFIAMFANSNYYDHDVYCLLSDMFFKHLRSSSEVVRIKDVSRVLWALSHAQHQCKHEDLEVVEDCIYEFCTSGDFLTHSSHAVDSTLYLTALDINSEKLMKQVLQEQVLEKFIEKGRTRFISRLLVLKKVQETFASHLNLEFSTDSRLNFPTRRVAKEFEYRPSIKSLGNAANWLRDECRTKVFNFAFAVPHIHYCSMLFCNSCVRAQHVNATNIGKHVLDNLSTYKDAKIAIDVDDENTSLNHGERANGLETLKRKILRMDGWDVKVLSSKDIESCGDDKQALAALILKVIQT